LVLRRGLNDAAADGLDLEEIEVFLQVTDKYDMARITTLLFGKIFQRDSRQSRSMFSPSHTDAKIMLGWC
jgi:hypothetical protein